MESRSATVLLASSVVVAAVSAPIADALFLGFILAAAWSVDWRRCWRSRRYRFLLALVASLCAWMLLHVFEPIGWGGHLYRRDSSRFPVTVLDYVPYLLAYVVLAARRRDRREVRAFFWALLASLPLHVVLAWGQRFADWSFRWRWTWGDVVMARVWTGDLANGRSSAGLTNHIALGLYATLCLAVGLALWLDFRLQRRAAGSTVRRLAAHLGFAAIVLASLFLLTSSVARVSFVVAAMTILFFLVLAGVNRWVLLSGLSLFFALLALAMMQAGSVSNAARQVLPPALAARLERLDGLRGGEVKWRLEVFECSWDLARERPWTGWGIGAMAQECEDRLGRVVNHAHNYFLQLASELGFPAALAFVLLLAAPLATFFRHGVLPYTRGDPILFHAVWALAMVTVLLSAVSLPIFHTTRLGAIFWWSHGAMAAFFWAPPPRPRPRVD